MTLKMPFELNWGFGVTAGYVVFASATLAFVIFATRQPIDLVSADYYAQGLQQDQRADAVENVRSLGNQMDIRRASPRQLMLTLPADHVASATGQITLYRPSDARADRALALAVDAQGHQTLALDGLAAGRWTVKVEWTAGGRHYYYETSLQIE